MTDSAVAKFPARLGLRVVVAAREGRERECGRSGETEEYPRLLCGCEEVISPPRRDAVPSLKALLQARRYDFFLISCAIRAVSPKLQAV